MLTFHGLIVTPLLGALKLSLRLLVIVVPLLLVFELIRALPFWKRFGGLNERQGWADRVGLSPHTLVPLFTGIFLGIVYGAGVIIKISREKALGKPDMWLMGLFLATCHAVVEDTLIFVVVGGMGWWIIIPRILLASLLSLGFLLGMKCKMRNKFHIKRNKFHDGGSGRQIH